MFSSCGGSEPKKVKREKVKALHLTLNKPCGISLLWRSEPIKVKVETTKSESEK